MIYRPSREFKALVNQPVSLETVIDGAILEVKRELIKREKRNQRIGQINSVLSAVASVRQLISKLSNHLIWFGVESYLVVDSIQKFSEGKIASGLLELGGGLSLGYAHVSEMTPERRAINKALADDYSPLWVY